MPLAASRELAEREEIEALVIVVVASDEVPKTENVPRDTREVVAVITEEVAKF